MCFGYKNWSGQQLGKGTVQNDRYKCRIAPIKGKYYHR
jgi:hypothetical protein